MTLPLPLSLLPQSTGFDKTIVTSNFTAGCPQREKPPVSGSKNWLPETEFELPQGDE
jgi:hypothetical protein